MTAVDTVQRQVTENLGVPPELTTATGRGGGYPHLQP